jgi:hypothetical protein
LRCLVSWYSALPLAVLGLAMVCVWAAVKPAGEADRKSREWKAEI